MPRDWPSASHCRSAARESITDPLGASRGQGNAADAFSQAHVGSEGCTRVIGELLLADLLELLLISLIHAQLSNAAAETELLEKLGQMDLDDQPLASRVR